MHNTQSPEFVALRDWFHLVRRYPPSEIFFQKYGKEAKAEERIQVTCESMYKFCFDPNKEVPVLSDFASALRDLEVLLVMGIAHVKPLYIKAVQENAYNAVKVLVQALDVLHKKDQLLQAYYNPWKVQAKVLQSYIWDLTQPYVEVK